MNTPSIKNGLLVLHGYNAGLRVWRGQLVCRYGTADETGELTLSKAQTTGTLRHIVIVAGDGLLTTQALRWLADIQISLTVIENDGRILLSNGKQNYPYATLARRQALAVYQSTGLKIAHWLMLEKLRGQAENLDRLGLSSERIREEMKAIPLTRSTDELIVRENRAAAHYWSHLEDIPLTFVRKDQARIPPHWFSLGGRMSPISKRNMRAATPGQAVINYMYAVAESVCAISLAAVGLNPDLGIIHTDVDNRRSMALDLIETIRPDADRLTFEYFRQQVFLKSDFWEEEKGSVRLGLDVRKVIIKNAFLLESRAIEYAVKLRDLLTDYKIPTLKKRSIRRGDVEIMHVCSYCGVPWPGHGNHRPGRFVCRDCREIQGAENLSGGNAPGFRWTETALMKHSKTSRARQMDINQWEAQFPENELQGILQRERQRFIVDIFPRLQTISATQISKQVGISLRYASLVKKGLNVPHPCLYPKFEECCFTADVPDRHG